MYENDLFYLASPYTHADAAVMQSRFERACKYTAFLMRQGLIIFSPIAHTHPIAVLGDLPRNWAFWQKYDRIMLRSCTRMLILREEGWTTSAGINGEIEIMQEFGKPIHLANFDDSPEQWELLYDL